MYTYALIYLAGAIASLVMRHRKAAKYPTLLAALFLLVFIGGRGQVGCDYIGYWLRFASLYPVGFGWREAFSMPEGGFHLLNVVAHDLGGGFNTLIVLCALIFVGGLTRFSMLATNSIALMTFAFPVLVVQLAMSGLRQACALGFLMMAYGTFTRGFRLRTALWIVVGFFFHVSAIVMLPLAFLPRRRLRVPYVLMALVLAVPLVAYLLSGRMEIYSDRYVDQIYGENSSGGAWIRYALAAAPLGLSYWRRFEIGRSRPEVLPLLRLFALATPVLIMLGLISTIALHRLTYYIFPVSLLALLALAESAVSPGTRNARLAGALGLYGAYLGSWFLLSRHASACYVPYKTWWLG